MDSIFKQTQLHLDITDFGTPEHADRLVHAGFLHGYMQLRSDIYYQIEDLIELHPNAKLAFVGHSLGGGLAVFAALEMGNMYNMTERTSLVTFGQPRFLFCVLNL